MNKHYEAAKKSVSSKIETTNFGSMGSATFNEWVDSLPRLEFMAFIDIATKHHPEDEPLTGRFYDSRNWNVWGIGMKVPKPSTAMIYVEYLDGSQNRDPDRVETFIWEDNGNATIAAWQYASNPIRANVPRLI